MKANVPAILDREVRTLENDAFGHRDLADALESLIESPAHNPPYSIGLLGSWGSGKSSIKEIYLNRLNGEGAEAKRDRNGRRRKHRIWAVTFNAWRYGGENIKRALLRHVYVAIGGKPDRIMDQLFHRFERSIKEPKSWKRIGQDFADQWLGVTVQLVLIILGLLSLLWIIGLFLPAEESWIYALIGISVFGALAVALKSLFSPNRLLIPLYSSGVRVDEPSSSAEQYEQLLIKQLEEFKDSPAGKSCERLVVFLDDLDRLSADEMVAGLDAVRTFLEIDSEKLPNELGLIFVISCDEQLVAEALAKRSRSGRDPDMPGTISDPISARRYLDRIFQFRLDVPEIPKLDMRGFAMQKLENELRDVRNDLEEKGVSIESVVDRLIHYDVQSPRNAIQILNSFSQAWWLAIRREREGSGTDRPGGLRKGVVTNHPVALAAVCGLRVNFPEFYNDLLKDRELIMRFTDVFRRGRPISEIPEAAQVLLKKYCTKDGEMRDEYRTLRRYIASLEGVRWPEGGILPLLQMAQDPITRELGEKERQIYQAMGAGDSQELLEHFDLDKTDKEFTVRDIRKLREVWNDLGELETATRRENAAACVAGIADRLPAREAHHLLIPLARELTESERLRSRLGIERITKLLPAIGPEEKRDIGSILIDDVLKAEGEISIQTDALQAPSLDQAKEMARKACDTVLAIRQEVPLSESADNGLREWLTNPRVSVKGSKAESRFSVGDIERWVTEHEDMLVELLRDSYSDLVIQQFEEDSLAEISPDSTLPRILRIFDILAREGAEGIHTVAEQLARLLLSRDETAVKVGSDWMKANIDGFNQEDVCLLITNLAERLRRATEDDDGWSIDWKSGASALIEILAARGQDVDEAASDKLKEVAILWGKDREAEEIACRLVDFLQGIPSCSSAMEAVTDDWIGHLFTVLSPGCVKWLAENFQRRSDTQQKSVVQKLGDIIKKDSINDDEAKKYERFIRHLRPEILKSDMLGAHLSNLCQHLAQRANNPEYVQRIFPVIPNVLNYCEPKSAGTMLNGVFGQLKSNVKIYSWAHGLMAEKWPIGTETLASYNPDEIFKQALSTGESHGKKIEVEGLILSLAALLDRGIVQDKSREKVVNLACKLWPKKPDTAKQILKRLDSLPSPADIAGLGSGLNLEEKENRDRLGEIWDWAATLGDMSLKSNVAKELLQQQPVEIGDVQDYVLDKWLCCSEKEWCDILLSLLADQDVSDEQVKRLWFRSLSNAEKIRAEGLLRILDGTLSEKPGAIVAVVEHRKAINERFAEAEQRYKLGEVLLRRLIDADDSDAMNRLGQWIKETSGESVLKELSGASDISDPALEALNRIFPNSRYLKKWKKRKSE